MDDFESRLENDLADELSGFGRTPLAEPVAVDELHRRARRVRAGRALTGFVAGATAVVLGLAVVATIGSGPAKDHARNVQVSAPSFVLGDIDAVVLSSSFDEDGARNVLPPTAQSAVAQVPGVKSVSGVIDTFAPVVNDDPNDYAEPKIPPRTPVLFSYHRDDQLHLVDGRLPTGPDEIAVDADFVSRIGSGITDQVTLQVHDRPLQLRIVGTFDLPGVDLAGIPLAAMSAAHQPPDLPLDRIDVNLATGASPANTRSAIAGAVGNDYTVVEPSAISFPDQRLAQLEIQRAYWALLSPDQDERSTSGVGPKSDKETDNYAKYSDLALRVELRVENVGFLSPDAAVLTYRIYYGSGPSPVIHEPQSGAATRVNGHWELGKSTLCSLAALVGISCEGEDDVVISPPNGYERVATLNPEILSAFHALTDPNATVDQRVAAIADGDADRSTIEAGLAQDQKVGKTTFSIAGRRTRRANNVEILYSISTESGPSTPWPYTALAQKLADGHWYAQPQYACGITGLAGGGCYTGEERIIEVPAGGETPGTIPGSSGAVATTSP